MDTESQKQQFVFSWRARIEQIQTGKIAPELWAEMWPVKKTGHEKMFMWLHMSPSPGVHSALSPFLHTCVPVSFATFCWFGKIRVLMAKLEWRVSWHFWQKNCQVSCQQASLRPAPAISFLEVHEYLGSKSCFTRQRWCEKSCNDGPLLGRLYPEQFVFGWAHFAQQGVETLLHEGVEVVLLRQHAAQTPLRVGSQRRFVQRLVPVLLLRFCGAKKGVFHRQVGVLKLWATVVRTWENRSTKVRLSCLCFYDSRLKWITRQGIWFVISAFFIRVFTHLFTIDDAPHLSPGILQWRWRRSVAWGLRAVPWSRPGPPWARPPGSLASRSASRSTADYRCAVCREGRVNTWNFCSTYWDRNLIWKMKIHLRWIRWSVVFITIDVLQTKQVFGEESAFSNCFWSLFTDQVKIPLCEAQALNIPVREHCWCGLTEKAPWKRTCRACRSHRRRRASGRSGNTGGSHPAHTRPVSAMNQCVTIPMGSFIKLFRLQGNCNVRIAGKTRTMLGMELLTVILLLSPYLL